MSEGRPIVARKGLFVVVCAARTGSSMLVNYLQSHPDITAHMEVYHPARAEGFYGNYRNRINEEPGLQEALTDMRNRHPVMFLYKIVFDAQKRAAAGFKFKYDELLLSQFAHTRDTLVADPDIRIIHLKRRNLLRRYVSHHLAANVTRVTMLRDGDKPLEVAPQQIDAETAIADIRKTLRMQDFIDKLFAGHAMHQVAYEDLTGPAAGEAMTKVQNFLGVAPHPLTTVLQRLSSSDLRRSIANFDAVQRSLAATPFASMADG